MRIALGLAISLLAIPPSESIAQSSQCARVYENAVRNFTVEQRVMGSRANFFNLHCERSGSVREGSRGTDIGVPDYLSFGTRSTDQETQLNEFCRVGASEQLFNFDTNSVANTVATDALRSFNDCRAAEARNLVIYHEEAHPYSVIFYGRFTGAGMDFTLDSIIARPANITCQSTNFSENGEALILDGSQRYHLRNRDFTITCERVPEVENGRTNFPRATIQLSTTAGPYTVTLPPDSLYGFDLASQANAMFEEVSARLASTSVELTSVEADRARARRGLRDLNSAIDNATAQSWMMIQGESDYCRWYGYDANFCRQWRCPQHGGPTNGTERRAEARRICGSATMTGFREVRLHPGNTCGYRYMTFTCMNISR